VQMSSLSLVGRGSALIPFPPNAEGRKALPLPRGEGLFGWQPARRRAANSPRGIRLTAAVRRGAGRAAPGRGVEEVAGVGAVAVVVGAAAVGAVGGRPRTHRTNRPRTGRG